MLGKTFCCRVLKVLINKLFITGSDIHNLLKACTLYTHMSFEFMLVYYTNELLQ